MTEQEAEEWAVRLARIWERNAKGHWSWQKNTFRFFINFPTGLAFKFAEGPFFKQHLNLTSVENDMSISLIWQRSTSQIVVEMGKDDEWYGAGVTDLHSQQVQAFVDEHLPFFRRGCWLSGCDIEASAHEKAEWIQGFPREELDAWNLKV